MILTKEEEKMLEGKFGHGVQKAMEILVSLGEIYGAKRMAVLASAHLSGAGATSAGDAGMDFVEEMYQGGARFRAWTTLNVGAIDFINWKQIGLSEKIVEKQLKLSELFRKMGSVVNHTCAPYFGLTLPRINEHVAWGDSGALLIANSVFGARTNREGGPSALAAAITGRVPMFGLHLDRNRRGDCLIQVKAKLNHLSDYSALGFHVGKLLKKGVPVFSNLSSNISFDELKALTALPAGGTIALFHVLGVTPEARTMEEVFPNGKPKNKIVVNDKDLATTFEEFNTGGNDPGLVVLGCPHASIQEIIHYSHLLEGKKISNNNKLWIFTSLVIKSIADRIGCTNVIERAGGSIFTDTCPVQLVDEVYLNQNIHCVTSDSTSILHYLSVYHGNVGFQNHFGSAEKCLKAGISGKWEEV
jgi:predicted aconitase